MNNVNELRFTLQHGPSEPLMKVAMCSVAYEQLPGHTARKYDVGLLLENDAPYEWVRRAWTLRDSLVLTVYRHGILFEKARVTITRISVSDDCENRLLALYFSAIGTVLP